MMEEAVFARYGLLGLIVLTVVTFGPRILDRLTAWAVRHAENEDRADEKVTDAFIEELRRSGIEREALRQERLTMTTSQQQLVVAVHTLNTDINALKEDIRNLAVLIKDFEARLSLYFRSKGEKP